VIRINIAISDVNDPPSFINSPFTVTIPEDAPPGVTVMTLSAIDGDSGALGTVTYFASTGEQ